MFDIKEKPAMGKPKARSQSTMLPKQAARRMKEKYLQELDPRQSEPGGETGCAADQVEDMGRWAVDELAVAPRRPDRQRQRVKERAGAETSDTPAGDGSIPERPANAPKERQAVEHRAGPGEEHARTTPRADPRTPKERPVQSRNTQPPGRAPAPDSTPAPVSARQTRQAQRQFVLNNRRRSSSALHQPTNGAGHQSAQNTPGGNLPQRAGTIKERTRVATATLKTRANPQAVAKAGRVTPKPRPKAPPSAIRLAARKTRQQAQRQLSRLSATRTAKAAKTAAVAMKRVAVAVTKAVAALVSAVAGIAGGGILLVALVIVVVIAAVANSPFGLFFAAERNAPGTVSVTEAVAQVNIAYNARLEELQAGGYDSVVLHGQDSDWPDVLAVFAVKLAGADADGLDVATLDADRVNRLTAVFWDMTAITTYVEEIYHSGSGDDDGWTEYILHITITPKTTDEMRTIYTFTAYQNSALDELLADRTALAALAGGLAITSADAQTVLDALPADLSLERRAVVETALTLYGKVNYFWGGKSLVLGWDSRWGQLKKVTADGSSTTGTYRPYGLDCSGFADWVFYNATGGDYIIGHGGGAHAQHTYCTEITWAEAIPGDLVFYPDDEHVGIVCGRDESGNLLAIHCASSANNVVITGTSGFTSVARLVFFIPCGRPWCRSCSTPAPIATCSDRPAFLPLPTGRLCRWARDCP